MPTMKIECPVITQEMMERRVHLTTAYQQNGLSDPERGEWDFIERQIKCADAWYANVGRISMDLLSEKHDRALEQLERIVSCLNKMADSKNVD